MTWQTKKLSEVCDTGAGGTPLKAHKDYYEEGNIPWLRSGEVCKKDIIEAEIFITEKGMNNSSARLFPKNTVLIAMYGATAGQVGILRFESTTNQAVCGILPSKNYISEFLYYYFLAKKEELVKQAVGGAQPNISQIKIKNTLVPFLDISEQQRIVKILDETFESIAKSKSIAEKNLQNSKKILESYLYNVFTDDKNGWVEKRLCDICEKITDGTHQTPTYFSDGIIFLSSRNVTSGKINWNDIKYIDDKQHREMHKRVAPRLNDILLAKNGTTGVAAIVDRDETFDIYVSLALLRPKEMVIPQFLLHFVNSPAAKKQFNKRLKGIGVPNLHLEEIREVEIKFPESKAEQMEIVSHINNLLSKTKKLESIYQQKLADLEELKKSILSKAFNGDL